MLVNSSIIIFVKINQNPYKQYRLHNKDALNNKELFLFQHVQQTNKIFTEKDYNIACFLIIIQRIHYFSLVLDYKKM